MTTRHSSTRRGFLQRTIAAATTFAVPGIIPAAALGRDGRSAPSNRITVGMIGLGRQAIARNLPIFLRSGDAQVIALCDADRWRLDTTQEKFLRQYREDDTDLEKLKSCLRTTDFREILARDDIDTVMISTPDHWHVPMAVAAAKAGKDICCEKPLARSIADGRILADTVKKHDRVFRTDSEFRSIPAFHRGSELVINGRIGQLRSIRVAVPFLREALPQQPTMPVPEELDYDMWLGPAPMKPYTEHRVHKPKHFERPGWYGSRDYSDGGMVNWGHHLADIAQWASGTERSGPVEVEGTANFPPADGLWNVPLEFDVRYRYADGVTLHYSNGDPFIRFEGTEGWINIQYGPDKLTAEPASILDSKLGSDEIRFPLKNEKRDFIDCVKTRSRTLQDAEVGHRATSLCLLGLIACQTGQKLKWDPVRERFLNSEDANRLLTGPPTREPWSV
jgi:myo-inositol 2-dehydrogenase / D-chiro-inositol 1-dehydrogenase